MVPLGRGTVGIQPADSTGADLFAGLLGTHRICLRTTFHSAEKTRSISGPHRSGLLAIFLGMLLLSILRTRMKGRGAEVLACDDRQPLQTHRRVERNRKASPRYSAKSAKKFFKIGKHSLRSLRNFFAVFAVKAFDLCFRRDLPDRILHQLQSNGPALPGLELVIPVTEEIESDIESVPDPSGGDKNSGG